MRYDAPVYFQTDKKAVYDPTTGNYVAEPPAEELRFAAVTDTGTDTLNLVYGEIKQGSLTIRLQRPFPSAFDRIRIGKKKYRVDSSKLSCRVFIVSEVQ